MARCLEIFGPEILSSLSFVTEHIDLDIGHTQFNAQQLSKLMKLIPEGLHPWLQQVMLLWMPMRVFSLIA